MGIRIVTDSACDVPQEMVDKYGIGLIPLSINIEERSYLDGVDISRKSFYESLPNYKTHPTTATPSMEAFTTQYQKMLDEGATEILSIHVSESLSATIDIARTAAKEFDAVPVHVFDSRQLSLGAGFLVLKAAEAVEMGLSAADITELLEEQISRTYVWAVLDTLEFLRRSGRLNGVIHALGSLLQIKPILKMYDGEPESENVRTRTQAYARLKRLLEEQVPLERVAIVHTNAPVEAENLRKDVVQLLPAGEHPSIDITPVIGAHIGPGAVGFAAVETKK